MSSITQITSDEIGRLNSVELVNILRILLHAEARLHCINNSGIHVPFEITVADGGNDGEWTAAQTPVEDYIPKPLTIFQCKASELGPADCKGELLASGKGDNGESILKGQVARAVKDGGAYVFFCRKGYVAEQIEDRLAKAREAFVESDITPHPDFGLFFWDGNKIATWVNQHASAVTHVCQVLGRPAPVAVVAYRHWENYPMMANPFQSTPQIDSLISTLRTKLSSPRSVARMTGPSGIGKTRIAFEIFRAPGVGDEEKIREALARSVVYLDFQTGGRRVLEWVIELVQAGLSGMVVVDNCSASDSERLRQEVLHPDSKVSLFTIDYVAEASSNGPALSVQLTQSMMYTVVPRILESYPELKASLGSVGIQRFADFAQGFPQMAILTAEAGQALDRHALNRTDIVDRLLWGREARNEEAEQILRCLAAFREIGRAGRHAHQLDHIRQILLEGMTETRFLQLVHRFVRNRILQEIGDFYMVTPSPLAVALAADWLESISPMAFQNTLEGLAERGLIDSFSNRLRQLDFSERIKLHCENLMGPNGYFSSKEVLNSAVGSRVFRSLCELKPVTALRCLTRVFADMTPHDLAEVREGRRNLVWALEGLCWSADLFVDAARILRSFAAGENETWTNNATGVFRQLFHVYLPGTQCPALDRLGILREGFDDGSMEVKDLCIEALGDALESRHFSRTSGAEIQGTKLPGVDWQPRSNEEVWDYWREVFQIFKKIILTNDGELATKAVSRLGRMLGGIVLSPLFESLEADFKEVADSLGNRWPEARDELRRARDHEILGDRARATAERWLGYVAPRDLPNLLLDKVATPGWRTIENQEGGYKDVSEEEAIELANQLAREEVDWLPHVHLLLTRDQQQTDRFGRRAIQLSANPRQLFASCLAAFSECPQKDRNPALLRGMISAFPVRDWVANILDQVAGDHRLRRDLLVPLTVSASPQLGDFERVQRLVLARELPVRILDWFASGGVSSEFAPAGFSILLDEIVESIPEAVPLVIHLAYMSQLRNGTRFEGFRELFSRLVSKPEMIAALKDDRFGHNWRVITEQLLAGGDCGTLVSDLATNIAADTTTNGYWGYGQIDVPFVVGILLAHHAETAWPIFASKLRTEENDPNFPLLDLLGKAQGGGGEFSPLGNLDDPKFRLWASENTDLLPHLLENMPLFAVETIVPKSEGATEIFSELDTGEMMDQMLDPIRQDGRYRWCRNARTVLELCGRDYVQDALRANLLSFGSTGSRVPYLNKRIALLNDLLDTVEADLAKIARALIVEIEVEIEAEKKFDRHRAAGIRAW